MEANKYRIYSFFLKYKQFLRSDRNYRELTKYFHSIEKGK